MSDICSICVSPNRGFHTEEFDEQSRLYLLAETLEKQGIQIETVKAHLKEQHIETPSWGYGNSGTRFGVFEHRRSAKCSELLFTPESLPPLHSNPVG